MISMSSSVHSMSLGHSLWETVIISPTVRGATEVLKVFLRRSAFVWRVMLSHRLSAEWQYWRFPGQGIL